MKRIFTRMLARMAGSKGLHTQAVLFFLMALSVFVFALGPDAQQNAKLMPGLVWALLLLSALLGLNDILEPDWTDGTVDDLLLSPHPLPALMAAKMLAHFTATSLPAAITATLCFAAIVPDAADTLVNLVAALLLGGLSFSALGLLGSVLVLGSRRAATLLGAIVMPLCVPPLIFGAGAANAINLGVSNQLPFYLLAAFACASATLAPFAAAAILRMKVTTS